VKKKLNLVNSLLIFGISFACAFALAPAFLIASLGKLRHIDKYYSPMLFIDAFKAGYGLTIVLYFFATFFLITLVIGLLVLMPKGEKQFGDARFANLSELEEQNLFGDSEGILIGEFGGRQLKFGGQQFVSLGAPTRSGKGVAIVIPNLLSYRNSCVVQDIKQECFDYTSLYREKILGQEVFLFNPFDRRTHRYNPLGYIDWNGNNVDASLMDFGNILFPLEGAGEKDSFFVSQAQNLFIGLCYLWHDLWGSSNQDVSSWLMRNDLDISFTMSGMLELSTGFSITPSLEKRDDGTSEFDVFKTEKLSRGLAQGESEPQPGAKISGFDDTYLFLDAMGWVSYKTKGRLGKYFENAASPQTKSSIMASFNAPILQYAADNMRLATSPGTAGTVGDFDLRDLRKKKMTIYVGITPDQLANARSILNLFWQQLILLNTKEMPQTHKELKYPCLLLMDEFTASGYLATYHKGISFIAGYWLRSLVIYQSQSQLEEAVPKGYGREGAATLLTNHACQLYYTPREQNDAEKLSKMLGTKTIKTRSRSYGQKGGGSSGSENEASRALMLPQEVKEIPSEEEIIMIEKIHPIRAKKAFYYNRTYFYSRFIEISPSLQKLFNLDKYDAMDDYTDYPRYKFMDDLYLNREELHISAEDEKERIRMQNEQNAFDFTYVKEEFKEHKGSKADITRAYLNDRRDYARAVWNKKLKLAKEAKDTTGMNEALNMLRRGRMFRTLSFKKKKKYISYERYFVVNKPLPQDKMEAAITAGETRISVPFQSLHEARLQKLYDKVNAVYTSEAYDIKNFMKGA